VPHRIQSHLGYHAETFTTDAECRTILITDIFGGIVDYARGEIPDMLLLNFRTERFVFAILHDNKPHKYSI